MPRREVRAGEKSVVCDDEEDEDDDDAFAAGVACGLVWRSRLGLRRE